MILPLIHSFALIPCSSDVSTGSTTTTVVTETLALIDNMGDSEASGSFPCSICRHYQLFRCRQQQSYLDWLNCSPTQVALEAAISGIVDVPIIAYRDVCKEASVKDGLILPTILEHAPMMPENTSGDLFDVHITPEDKNVTLGEKG